MFIVEALKRAVGGGSIGRDDQAEAPLQQQRRQPTASKNKMTSTALKNILGEEGPAGEEDATSQALYGKPGGRCTCGSRAAAGREWQRPGDQAPQRPLPCSRPAGSTSGQQLPASARVGPAGLPHLGTRPPRPPAVEHSARVRAEGEAQAALRKLAVAQEQFGEVRRAGFLGSPCLAGAGGCCSPSPCWP